MVLTADALTTHVYGIQTHETGQKSTRRLKSIRTEVATATRIWKYICIADREDLTHPIFFLVALPLVSL